MSRSIVRRDLLEALEHHLRGASRLMQVVVGPRQVGKTTLIHQVRARWKGPTLYASADEPDTPNREWIRSRWSAARALRGSGGSGRLLVLDEIQKVPGWSGTVKALWDEDQRLRTRLRVVLPGSSALLVQRGLTESLAGRFELHRHPHWSFAECREAFGLPLDDYLRFGGYPRALMLRRDPDRWAAYLRDAIIETVIGRDILLQHPVAKPALLRQTWGIAAAHPAEIVSLQAFIGQLTDAGNVTTIAHYLRLLEAGFMVAALPRWSGGRIRLRGSIPKIVVRDAGLVNAMAATGARPLDAARRGRLLENAVGSALVELAGRTGGSLYYWRERDLEVDYVLALGDRLWAIEVKAGTGQSGPGLAAFARRWTGAVRVLVGTGTPSPGIRWITPAAMLSRPADLLSIT